MKHTSVTLALTGLGMAASLATTASAQLLAVESFVDPQLNVAPVAAADGSALGILAATGFGFENWQVTNKGVAGDSRYTVAGLSYPANYDGGVTASGGSAIIDATSAGNATHSIKFIQSVQDTVAGASSYYFAFLGGRTGLTSTSTAAPINETALYPRNFGIRYLNSAGNSNSNSNLGVVGSAGGWSQSTDTWGQWGAKDTHGLSSSENIADGTDLIVVGVNNTGAGSVISIWTNPDSTTGAADISFSLTDGGNPLILALTGLGTEAGGLSGDRQPAVWNLDELRVGLTAGDTIGLSNLVAVPEPSVLGLLFGVLGLGFVAIRRRR